MIIHDPNLVNSATNTSGTFNNVFPDLSTGSRRDNGYWYDCPVPYITVPYLIPGTVVRTYDINSVQYVSNMIQQVNSCLSHFQTMSLWAYLLL